MKCGEIVDEKKNINDRLKKIPKQRTKKTMADEIQLKTVHESAFAYFLIKTKDKNRKKTHK